MTDDGVQWAAPASDQQRDWYERERIHRNPDLVISFRFAVKGVVAQDALRSAVHRLVERHESLRTSIHRRADGQVWQQVHREVPADCFWYEDLCPLDEKERTVRYEELALRERTHAFSFEELPLIRVGLMHTGEESSAVSVTLHHVIADGWAVGLLRSELSALLEAEVTGVPAALEPPVQCRVWSEAEREWAEGPEGAAQLSHWTQELASVRPLTLPPTAGRGADAEDGLFEHAEVLVPFDPAVERHLKSSVRTYRCTPTVLALTAYLKVMAETAGRGDVATMTMVTGRSAPQYAGVLGSLTNVVTVHAEEADQLPLDALVPQVRRRLLNAYAQQRLFVSRVWEQSHLGPGDVDSLFILDAFEEPPATFGTFPVAEAPAEPPRSFTRRGPWWENFKLRHTSSETAPAVCVEYNARLHDEEFARGFADAYVRLLGRL